MSTAALAPGKRLLSAAEFVRQGAYFADIGTDHAYLPLFLLKEGKIPRAVCADINRGPLESARKNAEAEGMCEKIKFFLTDGAAALSDEGITDYAICGMGGELIAGIIEAAPHLKSHGVRLILQPMTRPAHLRRDLAENGFSILDERYSDDGGKFYVCLCAEYTGEYSVICDFEAEFGILGQRRAENRAERGYLDTKIKSLTRAARGKAEGRDKSSPESELLSELERRKLI